MRVLITGCCGFIGSHCGQALLARGDTVVGVDNFDPFYDRDLKEKNLTLLRSAGPGQFHFVAGDLLDEVCLAAVFTSGSFDRVLHLAAKVGVRPSVVAPAAYIRANVEATTRLLQAMSAHGCDHLVFASSSSVYGDSAVAPFAETERADTPVSPYAASKRAAELICRTWHDLTGMHIFGLRLFTVYGPRQRPEMAFQHFAGEWLGGRPATMFGDGASSRNYTYIDDVVAGVLAALDRVSGFELINIGGSEEISLRAAIELLAAALDVPALITTLPTVAGDVRRTCADLHKAEALLKYEPTVGLVEGLARFAAWLHTSRAQTERQLQQVPNPPLDIGSTITIR